MGEGELSDAGLLAILYSGQGRSGGLGFPSCSALRRALTDTLEKFSKQVCESMDLTCLRLVTNVA